MTYSASQLITDAWYLSGIVPRGLGSVSGEQGNDGLNLLNALLAVKSVKNRDIPYFQEYDLPAEVAQEKYFVPNLISIETFTFNIGNVRFSTVPTTRKQYFGTPRVDGVQSLPGEWHLERTLGGAYLYIYFVPNTDYPLKIFGKFSLASVTKDQDLSLTLDLFYIQYLKYGLAKYICDFKSVSFPPGAMEQLKEYEKVFKDISTPDMTLSKISCFSGQRGISWAQVNICPGWTRL